LKYDISTLQIFKLQDYDRKFTYILSPIAQGLGPSAYLWYHQHSNAHHLMSDVFEEEIGKWSTRYNA
jgi:hypothetical protein